MPSNAQSAREALVEALFEDIDGLIKSAHAVTQRLEDAAGAIDGRLQNLPTQVHKVIEDRARAVHASYVQNISETATEAIKSALASQTEEACQALNRLLLETKQIARARRDKTKWWSCAASLLLGVVLTILWYRTKS